MPAQPDGLVLALERLAIQITSQCQIECRFVNESSTLISDAVMANHLFRIAQEAVNNAVKHADARHIDICLETVGRLNHLIVKDDGRGIAPNLQRRGSGIDIMRHRAAVIGGSFKVSSEPARGTAVSCFFPVNA